MSKKITVAALLVFCLGVFSSLMFGGKSEEYEKYEKYKYGFFPYYSSIDTKTGKKDEEKAKQILAEVEEALECTDEFSKEQLGELTLFAEKNQKYGADKINADVRLISAKFSFAGAYVWGEYDITIYDADGKTLSKEKDVLFYLKIKTNGGDHTVTKVKTIN